MAWKLFRWGGGRTPETIQKAKNLERTGDYLENALRAKSGDMALNHEGLDEARRFLQEAGEPEFLSRLRKAIEEYNNAAQLELAIYERPNDPKFKEALRERAQYIGRGRPLIEQLIKDIKAKLSQL